MARYFPGLSEEDWQAHFTRIDFQSKWPLDNKCYKFLAEFSTKSISDSKKATEIFRTSEIGIKLTSNSLS